jgi:hypothetical protein
MLVSLLISASPSIVCLHDLLQSNVKVKHRTMPPDPGVRAAIRVEFDFIASAEPETERARRQAKSRLRN